MSASRRVACPRKKMFPILRGDDGVQAGGSSNESEDDASVLIKSLKQVVF